MLCSDCHIGYADRQPTPVFLNNYYSNYYDSTQNITIKKELLINHIIQLIGVIKTDEEYNILDFGGGDGSVGFGIALKILELNNDLKINLFVVDPNSGNLSKINKCISVFNFKSIESLNFFGKMDLVIASAVLEHIKIPKKTILLLFEQLKMNGKFYARTPYIFPFKSLLHKIGVNLKMEYPEHLFDMGNKFWNSILGTLNQQNNFEIQISKASLVETTFRSSFTTTLIATVFKFPSRILKKSYHFVGGWEVLIKKLV